MLYLVENKTPENFWSTRICFLLCKEFQHWEIRIKQIIPVKSGSHRQSEIEKWGSLGYFALLSVFLWSPLSFEWTQLSDFFLFFSEEAVIVNKTQIEKQESERFVFWGSLWWKTKIFSTCQNKYCIFSLVQTFFICVFLLWCSIYHLWLTSTLCLL